jgi:hypothetical protein
LYRYSVPTNMENTILVCSGISNLPENTYALEFVPSPRVALSLKVLIHLQL